MSSVEHPITVAEEHLWRHQNHTKQTKDQCHYFVIKGPSKCFSFTLKLNIKQSLCEELFAEVEKLRGIPKTLQNLSYRKQIHISPQLCKRST